MNDSVKGSGESGNVYKSKEEIAKKLININLDWSVKDSVSIEKTFDFKDFSKALSFLNKVGEKAEKYNHHPDMCLHSFNKVTISLTTHDKGGVTPKDLKLAKIINNLTF
jgi:4a-hydroxytetrahydrobiopterin dehydratase